VQTCGQHLGVQRERLKILKLVCRRVDWHDTLRHVDITDRRGFLPRVSEVANVGEGVMRTNLRGHVDKLYVRKFRLICREYFFVNRVVNVWNALRPQVVNAKNVDVFRTYLLKDGVDVFVQPGTTWSSFMQCRALVN